MAPKPPYFNIIIPISQFADLEAKLNALGIGEKLEFAGKGAAGTEEKMIFSVSSSEEQQNNLKQEEKSATIARTCPKCKQSKLYLWYKRDTSDGACGIQRGCFQCPDPCCRLAIEHYYEGYDDIFHQQ